MYKILVLLSIFFTCYVQVNSAVISSEDNTSIIRRIIQKLDNAAKEGAQKLKEVLDSEYITSELKKLGMIYQSIAMSILNRFADLLQFLENKIRPGNAYIASDAQENDDSDIGLIIVTMSEEARAIAEEINRIVDEAYTRGKKALSDVINSKKLNDLIDKLPQRLGEYVRRKIREYASTLEVSAVSFDSLSSDRSFQDLWSRILIKHAIGIEHLEKFVTGQGYKDVYNSLTAEQKSEIDQLLETLTHTQQEVASFDAINTGRVFRDLWSRILSKHAEGAEKLSAFVKSEGYLDAYNSLTSEEKKEIDVLLQSISGQGDMIVSFDSLSAANVFRDLWSRILSKHVKGVSELEAFVNSRGYIDTYTSLSNEEKKEIDELLKTLLRKRQ